MFLKNSLGIAQPVCIIVFYNNFNIFHASVSLPLHPKIFLFCPKTRQWSREIHCLYSHSDIFDKLLEKKKNNLNTLFNSLISVIAVQPASSSAHIPQEICTAKYTPPASERKKYIDQRDEA